MHLLPLSHVGGSTTLAFQTSLDWFASLRFAGIITQGGLSAPVYPSNPRRPKIQKYHETLSLRYVLPTFLDRRVSKSEEILAQLRQYYGDLVCPAIRYNVRLSEAPGHGETIFEYASSSAGAEDYTTLTKRIVSDD